MGTSLGSLRESNIFGVRAVFSMDACHIFPQGVLARISLIVGVISVLVTRACPGFWVGPPLSSVVVTALSAAGPASQLLE